MTLRGALLYAACWTPLVLLYALLIGGPNNMSIGDAVHSAAFAVGVAALLGVPALWWAHRLGQGQLDANPEGAGRQPLVAHSVAATLYAVAWSAYIVYGIREALGSWDATITQVRPWIAWQLFFGLVVYAVIAGLTWGRMVSARGRQREARLRIAEAERARAELAVLRAQVDPHFLYNALHTATALVRRDPSAAERALEQLASLLRYVLDPARGARETVPLDEELQFVELYLAIEHARLGERLRVVMEIDDDARDVHVPSLSLQPLVENAIRHGLAPQVHGGTVELRAAVRGEQLVVTVSDDGAGAPPQGNEHPTRGSGIGLDALRKRLTARYGAHGTLQVTTAPGRGFTVTVELPA
ncbi:histidine kinase [Gemmatimonas sp.]|jgi:two-component system LytT family sensor kinase|uniref:sensor histidine kinase n=1 Tax=Gemmatimonas sp. TaxID=1962908 RepID=UPI0022C959BF|nr:histidine kinase [Gemmatimonas sp.]MCZ8205008.1 histidine kinase [Gemmatimonas sp.]